MEHFIFCAVEVKGLREEEAKITYLSELSLDCGQSKKKIESSFSFCSRVKTVQSSMRIKNGAQHVF